MRGRNPWAVILAMVMCLVVGFAGGGVAEARRVGTADVLRTVAGADLIPVACVLRNTGGGWSILSNSGHEPSNCLSITTFPDHIQVNYGVTASRVGAINVSPDETFAQQGLRAGASVGLSFSNVYMYDSTGVLLPPTSVVSAGGNWFFEGALRK